MNIKTKFSIGDMVKGNRQVGKPCDCGHRKASQEEFRFMVEGISIEAGLSFPDEGEVRYCCFGSDWFKEKDLEKVK